MPQPQAKILLVDDEPNVLLTAQQILQLENYSVDAVPDAFAAVRALENDSYDLVVTDLKMEGMDGLELLAHVQRQSPSTVTVMMTGYGSLDSALEAVRKGAYEYLLKPVAVEELKQAVRRSLEQKRLSEIDALYRVSTELARAKSHEAIEAVIWDAATRVLGVDYLQWLPAERDHVIEASGRLAALLTHETRARLEGGESVRVQRDPASQEPGPTSEAFIPSFAHGRLVGVLYAGFDQPLEFHPSAIRFLSGLAVQAAFAFDNLLLIAELRSNNASLLEANRKLKELDLLKSQFLSVATHELRTPLSVVLGYNAMLEESAESRLTTEERDLLRESLAACKRLMRLVNSMLDLSQIQSGKLRLQFTRSDLQKSVESVAALFEAEAQKRGIALEIQIAPDLPKVEMDTERMEQVLVNLVNNALKFTDREGSVRLEVASVEDSWMEIQVRDTGIGIAPENHTEIFDEFARVRHGQALGRPGSGLGLAIVRRIVEGHGGEITVNSAPGRGSVFRVVIPLRQRVRNAVCA